MKNTRSLVIILVLLALVFSIGSIASANGQTTSYKMSIAVLPVTGSGQTASSDIDEYTQAFNTKLKNTKKFYIISAYSVKNAMEEVGLTTSDYQDVDKIIEVGKKLYADLVVVMNLDRTLFENGYKCVGSYKVYNTKTGKMELSGRRWRYENGVGENVAGNIAGRYPMKGKILSSTSKNYSLSLGKTDGMRINKLMYVFRPKGDDYDFIGFLRIASVTQSGCKAVNYSLVSNSNKPKTGDVVTDKMIPRVDPVITYNKPLNVFPKKMTKIFSDNMKGKKYLSTNKGTYANGSFIMDCMDISTGFWNAQYEDIVEVPIRAVIKADVKVHDMYSWGAGIIFRSTYDIDRFMDGYCFLINPKNKTYVISRIITSGWNDFTDDQKSYHLKGVGQTNKLMMVINGSKLDFYINGKFQTAIKDWEFLDGSIGTLTMQSVKAGFTNIEVFKW